MPIKKILLRSKILSFVQVKNWEFVERNQVHGIVAIFAMTNDGNVLLTEQYRPPVQKKVIELPGGLAGDSLSIRHEPLLNAAKRELLEEVGYKAKQWIPIALGPTSAGLTSEVVTLFYAQGLTKIHDGGGVDSEKIKVLEIPLQQMQAWLKKRTQKGWLIDFKVYAGLYFALTQKNHC